MHLSPRGNSNSVNAILIAIDSVGWGSTVFTTGATDGTLPHPPSTHMPLCYPLPVGTKATTLMSCVHLLGGQRAQFWPFFQWLVVHSEDTRKSSGHTLSLGCEKKE